MMIVVRDTFQAKFGKAGALVALFKELRQQRPWQSVDRIFTDASGPFDTVVTEATAPCFGLLYARVWRLVCTHDAIGRIGSP